jgi:hypothetical protein
MVMTDQGGGLSTSGVNAASKSAAASARPEPALTDSDVSYLIVTAGRAPSVHNTQPWKFRAGNDGIELLADRMRMLPWLDPDARELTLSCGAALFGLRLGFRKLGYAPAVETLPDPAQPGLLARLQPGSRAAMSRAEAELLTAVPHRHTHRAPFAPGGVSARLLTALQADAAAEGADLRLIDDPALVSRLGRLVELAAAEQRADAKLVAELERWIRPPDSQVRDGVPAWARTGRGPAADAPAAAASRGLQNAADSSRPRLPERDFGSPGSGQAGGFAPSAIAILSTRGDTAADWLRAGQALHRLLLHAATRWVFASLQSQPLESRACRDETRALLEVAGYPQMLLQFGRANTAAATPRRPRAELNG